MYIIKREEVIDAKVFDTSIEIIVRIPSNSIYLSNNGGAVPDRIEKRVYCADVDGNMILVDTIIGKMMPEKVVPKHIEWNN